MIFHECWIIKVNFFRHCRFFFFFQPKILDIFISAWKYMLWVLIRSASPECWIVKVIPFWLHYCRFFSTQNMDIFISMQKCLFWVLFRRASAPPNEYPQHTFFFLSGAVGVRSRFWDSRNIRKTCIYNIDPLKPHFYIVRLGFIGVYIIFLISAQKHRLWVLVRTASLRQF